MSERDLVDEVVREVFDIPHVFPVEFHKEEKHGKKSGFWRKVRDFLWMCLGFRRANLASGVDKQGAAGSGGS
ncbi:MAG: hypothetical protein EBT15_07175 [Betaproteobacteria bacterium]|nr:hypothetical protein [Betaproteobacteria bacterium]